MICLMPLKLGQKLDSRVLAGIVNQTVSIELFVSTNKPIINAPNREYSINYNRHELQQFVPTDCTDNYIMLMDSDVVIEDTDAIEKLVSYLDNNPEINCVSIDTKNIGIDINHVLCACSLIRRSCYKTIDYLMFPHICQCLVIKQMFGNICIPDIKACEIERVHE